MLLREQYTNFRLSSLLSVFHIFLIYNFDIIFNDICTDILCGKPKSRFKEDLVFDPGALDGIYPCTGGSGTSSLFKGSDSYQPEGITRSRITRNN